MKKVRFVDKPKTYICYVWIYAYREARKSNWTTVAVDRHRFEKRIKENSNILEPILRKKLVQQILYDIIYNNI